MQTAIGSGLVSASDYKSAMRRLLGGVCLVTTRVEGLPVGCTATAVTSVSADPPMLLTCLNKGSKTRAAVLAAGVFGISVLKADRIGAPLCRHGGACAGGPLRARRLACARHRRAVAA